MKITAPYRYVIEQDVLPGLFFATSDRLLKHFADAGFLARLYREVFPGIRLPYTAESFAGSYQACCLGRAGTVRVITLRMPAPDRELLCRSVYLCVLSNGQRYYLTSEKNREAGYSLCRWSESGAHYDYGPAEEDEISQVLRICLSYNRPSAGGRTPLGRRYSGRNGFLSM